jgi:putative intracellular protease/amidase
MSIAVRSKWVVAEYGLPIAVVLAVVGLFALGGAYDAYANPPTERVTETVDEQRVATAMGTSAVVTGETSLYSRGETLTDRSAYFFNATPEVTVGVATTVPDGRAVDVSKRLTLHHEATRDGEPFWQSRRVLATADERTEDGEVAIETTLNMTQLRETVADRRQEIGTVGRFRTELRLHVAYETGEYARELTASVPVVLTDRAYWFEGDLAANRTHSETVTREVVGEPDMGAVLGLGGHGLGALLLAVGVAALSHREFDIDAIETELVRSRYDEWISRGEIPTKAEKQYIRIDTLEDLVDIAIDSSKRVIYDDTYDAYGVVDADIVYYYTDQEAEFDQWLEV